MLAIGLIFTAFACNMGTSRVTEETLAPGTHKVIVNDVLHTSIYTYLNVDENGTAFWIAIPRKEVEKGKTIYYSGGYEMPNFKSKELDRTFETLYLVEEISYSNNKSENQMPVVAKESGKRPVLKEEALDIKPGAGEISLAEVFSNRASYAGKTIKIRGKVVKVNESIMGKNWVHIQDGSQFENNYDLTVTTLNTVKIGEIVSFEGVLALNKDFGAGYFYEVILEEAKATIIKNL